MTTWLDFPKDCSPRELEVVCILSLVCLFIVFIVFCFDEIRFVNIVFECEPLRYPNSQMVSLCKLCDLTGFFFSCSDWFRLESHLTVITQPVFFPLIQNSLKNAMKKFPIHFCNNFFTLKPTFSTTTKNLPN